MNQTINEGGIASFNCQASGEPLPTISWYFNGVALDDSNTAKYTITDRLLPNANMSVLNIMDVESSDSGTYTCNATNVVSTDTSSGVLIVNGQLYTTYAYCYKVHKNLKLVPNQSLFCRKIGLSYSLFAMDKTQLIYFSYW